MALVLFFDRQKRTVFRCSKTVRLFYCFIITSSEQIVERNVKIIRKANKSFIIRLAFKVFVARYGILVHIQIKRKLQLRYIPAFPQFFEPKFHFPLLFLKIPLTLLYHFGII